jgi:hypothetical protein
MVSGWVVCGMTGAPVAWGFLDGTRFTGGLFHADRAAGA